MPIEYELLRNGTIVMARATGVLSLDCFMSMQKVMKADENLQNPHNTLLDVRSVSKIDLNESDLNIIALGLTSEPKVIGANRLAIVATSDQAFALGNKYYTTKKGVSENVIVFYNIEIAQKWLGLDM